MTDEVPDTVIGSHGRRDRIGIRELVGDSHTPKMEACPRWEGAEVSVPEGECGRSSRKREADVPQQRYHREPRYYESGTPGSGRRG